MLLLLKSVGYPRSRKRSEHCNGVAPPCHAICSYTSIILANARCVLLFRYWLSMPNFWLVINTVVNPVFEGKRSEVKLYYNSVFYCFTLIDIQSTNSTSPY